MKILKKWWFWLGAVGLVILIIVLASVLGGGEKTEMITEQVARGDLVQTVDVTGELTSIDKVELAFETSGTLGDVKVEVGDYVEEGELLAQLGAADLTAEVRRAEQSLAIADAQLQLELAGATNEAVAVILADVSIAEANLDGAESDLRSTYIVTAADVNQARIRVETAQADYNNTIANNAQDLIEVREDVISAMKSALIDVRSGMSTADKVLGVENTIIDDDYQTLMEDQGGSTYNLAEAAFNRAIDARDTAEDLAFVLTIENTDEEIDEAIEAVEEAIFEASLAMTYSRQVLDMASMDTAAFSLTDLLSLKTSLDTARTSLQTQETSFISYKQTYSSALLDIETSEISARNNLAITQSQYESALAAQDSQINAATAARDMRAADLQRSQARLAEIEADPRAVDLAALYADVNRAKADLDAANARLRKSQIVSPIDGVITDVTFELGEQIVANNHVVTVQTTDDDKFKVELLVPEADIVKISIDDPAEITFDAFGDDITVRAKVGAIDPAERQIEGVVYYEVEAFFTEDISDLKVRPGMSVDAIVTTAEEKGALYVPQRSVLENDENQKYIRVPRGRGYEEVLVEVGLRADGGKLQLLSGVEEGDEIIITIR